MTKMTRKERAAVVTRLQQAAWREQESEEVALAELRLRGLLGQEPPKGMTRKQLIAATKEILRKHWDRIKPS